MCSEKECDDERAALANLTLDTEENKKILKQLKKANASLTQDLKECKSNLEESNTTRDSCLIAFQSKQTDLETYKTLIDHTVDYDKLEQKHDELVKQSFLTKSHYEDLVKEKTKVQRIENEAKTVIFGLDSIKFTYYSRSRRSRGNSPSMPMEKAREIEFVFVAHDLRVGKEIAKPITPPSESASKEDSDPEQAQRDKDMQKNLALIANLELGIHDHSNEPSSSKLVPKVVTSADTTAPSKQEFDLLFGPLYDEFFTEGTSCVNKSSSPTDNSTQHNTPPSATAQSTTELITPTTTITAADNM
ncbi:hypothetical protein Tco_0919256 [Tanacetum coccineum]